MHDVILKGELEQWIDIPPPSSVTVRRGWLLVVGGLLAMFILTNYLLLYIPSMDLNIYVAQPLLWLSLALLVFWLIRSDHRIDKLALRSNSGIMGSALVLGLFQVALLVIAGLLAGFAHSPYAHTPLGIGLNLWFVGAQILGLELGRWYLVAACGNRKWLGLALAWLLPSLIMIPSTRMTQLGQTESGIRFVGSTLLPVAAENMLATYLTLVGGPLASISYRGTLIVFEWFSPVLPAAKWTFAAFVGTLAPTLGLLAVRNVISQAAGATAETSGKPASSGGTATVLVASCLLFLMWFNMGLFGVRPLVTVGGSMEPTMYAGDLTITRDVASDELKVGDIIRFTDGRISILHRVRDVRRESGRTTFITQGDNNNALDMPVTGDQLQGKLVLTIPKVGWVSIYAKQLIGGWR